MTQEQQWEETRRARCVGGEWSSHTLQVPPGLQVFSIPEALGTLSVRGVIEAPNTGVTDLNLGPQPLISPP